MLRFTLDTPITRDDYREVIRARADVLTTGRDETLAFDADSTICLHCDGLGLRASARTTA